MVINSSASLTDILPLQKVEGFSIRFAFKLWQDSVEVLHRTFRLTPRNEIMKKKKNTSPKHRTTNDSFKILTYTKLTFHNTTNYVPRKIFKL